MAVSGGNQLLDALSVLKEVGIKQGYKVADLGCGAVGHFTFPAAEMVGKDGLVYAVDIRKIVLAGIKNRARIDGLTNIEVVWSNLEVPKSTGILNSSLDIAMLFNTLFQSKKREGVLKESIRMIKPQGYLAVVDWQLTDTLFGPVKEDRVDPEAVIQFCRNNGMELEKEFVAGKFHFGLLFKKIK